VTCFFLGFEAYRNLFDPTWLDVAQRWRKYEPVFVFPLESNSIFRVVFHSEVDGFFNVDDAVAKVTLVFNIIR